MSKDDEFEMIKRIVRGLDTKFPNGTAIYQRISRLCEESGELASAVNHREGMGIKNDKHGEPSNEQLVKEIQDVIRCALGIAMHYGVEEQLSASIAASYDKLKADGFIQ